MTFTRYCDDQRQPCPSPHKCQHGCYFNEAELLPSMQTEDEDIISWIKIGNFLIGSAVAMFCLVMVFGLIGYVYGVMK